MYQVATVMVRAKEVAPAQKAETPRLVGVSFPVILVAMKEALGLEEFEYVLHPWFTEQMNHHTGLRNRRLRLNAQYADDSLTTLNAIESNATLEQLGKGQSPAALVYPEVPGMIHANQTTS